MYGCLTSLPHRPKKVPKKAKAYNRDSAGLGVVFRVVFTW